MLLLLLIILLMKFCAFFRLLLMFVCILCSCLLLCWLFVFLCFSKMFVLEPQSIDFQVVTKFKGGGEGVNSTIFLCGANAYFRKKKI